MSEKSEFETAIGEFQKEFTSILLELSASSDAFKESVSFPVPIPSSPAKREPTKSSKKKTVVNKDQENEETKETKESDEAVPTEFTQEEIDEVIVAASKRTGQSLESKGFMRNVRKKLPNVDKQIILNRILELKSQGKIVENTKEQ